VTHVPVTNLPKLRDDRRRLPAWAWRSCVTLAALVPFLPGLTGSRVFYVRDLSLYFWGRYLWLRRAWLSGEWPLWDPYVGGGQSAYSDALNQMFLLPSVIARLAGGEVLGFNLWVALPFPLAAIGAFGFFARRFSASASALGAMAFALCGPVVSTGNFPNLSWSVAATPWVLWATDAVVSTRTARPVAPLALAVALQAFAGEPVTQFATLVVALVYAVVVGAPDGRYSFRDGLPHGLRVGAGIALGVLLAAIQLLPMAQAASRAGRANAITQDFWSLRPTAIVETVWLHLFGNYFNTQSLAEAPWMPLMFTGREPFFFSVYFGVPLMALCVYGLAGSGHRRWRLFWVAAGFASLVAAFGAYTPIYPIFRDYVPLFGSFRFPVKYLVIAALAVAAGAAMGWDALASERSTSTDSRRLWRAKSAALGFAAVVGGLVGLLALACVCFPGAIRDIFAGFAVALGARDGMPAADFMLRTFPRGALPIVFLSFGTAGLLWRATREGGHSTGTVPVECPPSWVRLALYVLIVGDLLVRAWGINPVIDPVHMAEPAWLAHTRADTNARFYVGGKKEGTLDALDIDASRAYLNAPGLTGSASRAALSIQAAYYPSAWRSREMLSYDLAVLWPRIFTATSERFTNSKREERDRFLDRTGVRYRILPARHAAGHSPIMPIPYFQESFLFDWSENVMPRVSVLTDARVVPDVGQQVDALFEPGWDSRTTALIDREPEAAGNPGPPAAAFARFLTDTSNRVRVEAGAGADGGYLVLLDSYSADWRVMVDGRRADMVQANGLFRAVRLTPGRHDVEFVYRPRALVWGAAISGLGLIVTLGLLVGRGNEVSSWFASGERRV
jgi:hypothetical protein